MLSCAMCVGWWAGLAVCVIGWPLPNSGLMQLPPVLGRSYAGNYALVALLSAFASSGVNWLIHVAVSGYARVTRIESDL